MESKIEATEQYLYKQYKKYDNTQKGSDAQTMNKTKIK